MYGSNDNGTNWTELDSQTNQTVSAWGSQLDFRDTKREYTVTGNTKYFSSYKLDVTANGGDGNYVVLTQIEYYGDEEGFLSDDGFGKLTLDVKGDTSATSNIVFHSNTYTMGAARDLYITDLGEYTADIYGSSKHFLGSKTHTISTVDTVPGFTAAFHHGAFSASDYSSAYSTVGAAATAGHVYSDTTATTYTWGTLNSVDTSTSGQTGYSWTPTSTITADVLMVAGGGGGGGTIAGGGGAGGVVYSATASISAAQQTIVVGDGGTGGKGWDNFPRVGSSGTNTSFTGLTTAIGGGGGSGHGNTSSDGPKTGGSGGGGAQAGSTGAVSYTHLTLPTIYSV